MLRSERDIALSSLLYNQARYPEAEQELRRELAENPDRVAAIAL